MPIPKDEGLIARLRNGNGIFRNGLSKEEKAAERNARMESIRRRRQSIDVVLNPDLQDLPFSTKLKKWGQLQLHELAHLTYWKRFIIDADLLPKRQNELGHSLDLPAWYQSRRNIPWGGIGQSILGNYLLLGSLSLPTAGDIMSSLGSETLQAVANVAADYVKIWGAYIPLAWNLGVKLPRSYGFHINEQALPAFSKDHRKGTFSVGLVTPFEMIGDYVLKDDGPLMKKFPKIRARRRHLRRKYNSWRGYKPLPIAAFYSLTGQSHKKYLNGKS